MKKETVFSKTNLIVSTIVLGLAASFSHFAYHLSGNNVIVGIFNPVNESVWEHMKFMFFPLLLWWIIMHAIKRKKGEVPFSKWVVASAVSLATAPLLVMLLFYAYTGALGVESVIIDILLVFIGYAVALMTANHLLRYLSPPKWAAVLSVAVIAALLISFIVLTFWQPELPLFYDTLVQQYGISQ